MAHQLEHEVWDHAPADLSQAELNVLLVIAFHARVETGRRCWSPNDVMQRRTRLTASALKQALQRLAKRGLEVRVALGVDKAGRPVYAHRGTVTTYELPVFPAPAGCTCRPAISAVPALAAEVPRPRQGDVPQFPSAPEGAYSQSPYPSNGDYEESPYELKGDSWQSPSVSDREKGDYSQSDRGLQAAPQYRRSERTPGGTTDVTPGPHTNPHPPILEESRPPAGTAPAAGGDPTGSLCGQRGCRAPGPCRACGAVRTAAQLAERDQRLAAKAAELDRRQAIADEIRTDRQRAATARAAAIAACDLCDSKGWCGPRQRCDHQRQPAALPAGRLEAIAVAREAAARSQQREYPLAPLYEPDGGRHRLPEPVRDPHEHARAS